MPLVLHWPCEQGDRRGDGQDGGGGVEVAEVQVEGQLAEANWKGQVWVEVTGMQQ